ncbi:hypothetical protein C0995_008793 [Termitomyces sp. Mi166|nr:hypothetical protein C0995_008793 [Termitomyces sp. Mi166\
MNGEGEAAAKNVIGRGTALANDIETVRETETETDAANETGKEDIEVKGLVPEVKVIESVTGKGTVKIATKRTETDDENVTMISRIQANTENKKVGANESDRRRIMMTLLQKIAPEHRAVLTPETSLMILATGVGIMVAPRTLLRMIIGMLNSELRPLLYLSSKVEFKVNAAPLIPRSFRRASPVYEPPQEEPYNPDEPKEDDSEARSVFVSQLAARLTARDLGYFFEDKLGEGTVMDSRIVTDRLSRRSKGIGYVEFRSIDLVEKAIALSGTVVMGLPIMVQLTESERNKLHPGDGCKRTTRSKTVRIISKSTRSEPHLVVSIRLYVGSLHFNLTESDIKQVFEPFGELEFVDLHRDPMTGRSKGYAFVQYKRAEDARMALEQMEGFELAGRQLRVNTVHEKGTAKYTQQDSLDEAGGGNLNAASRQALMQKLARTEPAFTLPEPVARPNITQTMQSRSVLLKNMFDPEEETERDWDKDLAEDVKGECEDKYGSVEAIKVEKETQGEIYVKFDSIETAKKAVQGLNGRWFGGKQVSAAFISDAIMQAHQ